MAIYVRVHSFLLLFLMFTCLASEEGNITYFQRREHSLIKPYQGSGLGVPHWDLLGSTVVTNNYIRLTADVQSVFGAIWNNVPCHAKTWELHIQFKVHGNYKKLFGDGFAVWYTKERMKPGQVFGNIDLFTGLAIFLDTFKNSNLPHQHSHPYISIMVNTGHTKYDHGTDGTYTTLTGCESQFRNKAYETYLAIRYEADTIMVSTDVENKNTWKECFSVKDVNLPTGYYFGVSAVTGDLSDNHDIISIKMYDLDTDGSKVSAPSENTESKEPLLIETVEDSVDDDGDSQETMLGWELLATTILLVFGVGGCIVAGITLHKQQELSRKRFY